MTLIERVEGDPEAPIPLSRSALSVRSHRTEAAAPIRIVHLGLGAFHRAHQAWYTAAASDGHRWGIAAFTGRSPEAAEKLAAQDGLYLMVERSEDGDDAVVVQSLVEANDGADVVRLVELLAASTTAVVTLTVTEAGYRLTNEGQPDLTDALVRADVGRLCDAVAQDPLPVTNAPDVAPVTALGRLLLGLEARRRAGGAPVAVVPCDNMPNNGAFVRTGLLGLAQVVSAELAGWIAEDVSFVSTSVDRITPRTTQEDIATAARLSGWMDRAPVIAEPFTDWVLQGRFPAGRPAWETAGARFVEDVEPFERRKLWLLNGAHTLLAYAGPLMGYQTVAAAIGDPVLRRWVEDYWDEAVRHLPAEGLDLPAYRDALVKRFQNSRIEHRLSQIGADGVTKLRVRIGEVALAELADGRPASASARAFGAWVSAVQGGSVPPDARSSAVEEVLAAGGSDLTRRLVELVDERLASDDRFLTAVRDWHPDGNGRMHE